MKTNKELLNDIKKALGETPALAACLSDIYILVNEGAVILSGQVGTQERKALIQKIVSGVPGVEHLIEDTKAEPSAKHRVGVEIDWASGRMVLH